MAGRHRRQGGALCPGYPVEDASRGLDSTFNADARKLDRRLAFVRRRRSVVATRVLLVATQHRLQWQAEQVLDWSALPVVQIRPTVLLENPLFTTLIARSVAEEGVIRLPFGEGRTSPVAAEDVARSVAAVLQGPEPHMAVAGTPGLCTDDQACGISCRQPARHRE
jgi:uncharacterized protein YbjT (DUF2867 family)